MVANGVFSLGCVWWLGAWGAAVGTIAALVIVTQPYYIWHIKQQFDVRVVELFSMRKLGSIALVVAISSIVTWVVINQFEYWMPISILILAGCVYGVVYMFMGRLCGVVNIKRLLELLKDKKL